MTYLSFLLRELLGRRWAGCEASWGRQEAQYIQFYITQASWILLMLKQSSRYA